MKISPQVKALLVVILLAGVLWLLWIRYRGVLTRGRMPPRSTQILMRLEKHGIPDFSFRDLSGQKISLAKFHGKVVLLNFFASWCDPCVAEFLSLLKLVDHFKGKVVLIAVSADYTLSDLKSFLGTFHINSNYVHVIWDKNQKLAQEYGTFQLPESYIIDRKGRLVRKIAGSENWASSDAYEFFKDVWAGRISNTAIKQ